jgi:hypothetical protein
MMIKLEYNQHHCIRQLCDSLKDDVVLWGFVEGNEGCAWTDDIINPRQAIIIVADFCYLLGRCENAKEIETILNKNGKYKVIILGDDSWVQFLNESFPKNHSKYKRYAIKREPNVFSYDLLSKYATCLDNKYKLKRIDKDIYFEVLGIDWAADGCCYFSSVDVFLNHGLGYVIYYNNEIVSIASSYCFSNGNIEITIGTADEHRRKGLALVCASQLILDCIKKNIYPKWEGVDMISVALAEKLGYHFETAYDVYSIN